MEGQTCRSVALRRLFIQDVCLRQEHSRQSKQCSTFVFSGGMSEVSIGALLWIRIPSNQGDNILTP